MGSSVRRLARLAAVAALAALAAGSGLPSAPPAAAAPTGAPGSYGVAVSERTFTDPSRPTPARSGAPASSTRTIHEVVYDPSGPAGELPTVLFAPGFDDQSSGYDRLLRTIASAGFLVVGVDSPGSSSWFAGTPTYTATDQDIGNDTVDLSAALTDIERGDLGGRVDPAEVAALGHSDGGSVVANLALNPHYRSSRFSSYASLAGNVPTGLVDGSFDAATNGPLLAMVGTADEYANYNPSGGEGTTEQVYDTAGAPRVLATIAGGSHLSPFVGTGAQADDARRAVVDFLAASEEHLPAARSGLGVDLGADGLSASEDLGPSWSTAGAVVGMATTADGDGDWLAEADGVVRNFGDAAYLGRLTELPSPVAAIAGTPDGGGFWLVTAAGAVTAFGDAVFHGDLRGRALAAPVVAMATDPATGGYWLLGGDGGVFSFAAPFEGSTGAAHLNAPAVGMAATADGSGYWFAASDGGVFSFGDATFHGSMGGRALAQPVVGLAADLRTGGYWLDASDGGIFSFDAPFEGSTGATPLQAPCVAMSAAPPGPGYRLVAADGGIFDFAAPYEGSAA